MREHLIHKNLLHATGMAWKAGAPLPADSRGDIFHATQRGQLYRQGKPDENLDGPVKGKDGHDIISAVQSAHESTVALWLAGSWCCNLGSNGTSAPHSERPVSFLSGRDAISPASLQSMGEPHG